MQIGVEMSSQVERGTIRNMVHAIAFRAGVLERILQEPVLGCLEIRTDELAHVQLLQRQIDDLRRYLSLPSVEPERKKGRWQRRKGSDCWECSQCHAVLESDDIVRHNFYYCYHCGADMMSKDGWAEYE